MSKSRPVEVLRSLLEGHDLEVTIYEDWCLVGGGYPAFKLTHFPPEEGTRIGRLCAEVQFDDAKRVVLNYGAIGEGEEGFAYALKAFVTSAFHVFLTVLCGANCCDQTDSEIFESGEEKWRVTNGPLFFRFADAGRPPMPEGFWPSMVAVLKNESNFTANTHWISLFFSRSPGSDTLEALLDNEPWTEGQAALESMQWPQWGGFYSARIFAMLQPA